MKKLVFIMAALVLSVALLLVSCGETEPTLNEPPANDQTNADGTNTPTSISLSKLMLSMYVGESYELGVKVYPADADVNSITWTSTNPAIAECSGGVVMAKSVGSAIISASSPTSRTVSCTVTVAEKPLSEEDLKSLVKINLPEFPVRINYTDPTTQKSAIAEISNAVVRMREDKNTETGEDVARVFVKFNVTKVYDQDGIDGLNPIFFKFILNADSGVSSTYQFEKRGAEAIKIGERFTLINQTNAANVSLDSAEIGFAFDARNYKDGREFDIEVLGFDDDDVITNSSDIPSDPTDKPTEPGEITVTLSNKHLYLAVDGAFALVGTVTDENGNVVSGANIIWESTDEDIATCKGGLITARSEGMTAIYARVGSSVAVCAVTVIDPARMITFTLPDMPIELDCIDPQTGKKTSFIVRGCSLEHVLDYREGDGNFVRITMKFDVEKTYDEEGADGTNMVGFSINLYEDGFAGMLESMNRGETKIKVGEICTVEYVFGARFHEGRRNFKVELQPIAE